jgi:RHS repeat-associated protein
MRHCTLLLFVLSLQTLPLVAQTTPVQVYKYSVPQPGPGVGYDPTGNLLSYTDNVNGNWSAIVYDGLNRVIAATLNANGQATQYLCWTYDSFGNRKSQTVGNIQCNVASPPPPTSSAQYNSLNQITSTTPTQEVPCLDASGNFIGTSSGLCYDAAGDVTAGGSDNANGTNQYLYDAEGRVCAVGNAPMSGGVFMTQYIYDAEGRRVAKGTINKLSCDTSKNGFVQTNSYILGQSGEQITEIAMNNGTSTWHSNVYAAGQLLATYDAIGSGLHFHIADPLGNRRVQISSLGTVDLMCVNLPFGDNLSCAGPGTDSTEHHFTGKERDSESGLDYFGARYYGSTMGRFMSPDWAKTPQGVPYADLTNPQSLNLYEYVGNNPLSKADPDGHCWPFCDFIAPVANYLADHPAVSQALDKLGDSIGLRASVGAGAKIDAGPVKINLAVSAVSDARVDGTSNVGVQGAVGASAGSVGVQGSVTAPVLQNGSLTNPVSGATGNLQVNGKTALGDDVNGSALAGTNGRTGVGVSVNAGVVQAGLQVTASTGAIGNVGQAVVSGAVQDTRQAISNIHELQTCQTGACAIPH